MNSPKLSRRLLKSKGPLWRFGLVVGSAFGLVALNACDVALFQEEVQSPTSNTCESNSACFTGKCVQGSCQVSESEIPAFLLEVTPSSSVEASPPIAGLSFIRVVVGSFELEDAGYFDLELDNVSVVQGSVSVSALSSSTCLPHPDGDSLEQPQAGSDGSVPARLTLTPRARLLGLPNPLFTGANETLVNVEGGSSYQITMNIPPGRYDVYAEPVSPVGGCIRPPFLIVDQEIPSGDVKLNLELPAPEILGVTVRYPRASDDLAGWTIDIVQKDSGRLLSNSAVLREPEEVTIGEGEEAQNFLEYRADIAFSPGAEESSANELVRLSPPEAMVAPTIYLERSFVDLFQDGTGLVDQLKQLEDPVEYQARVSRADGEQGSAPVISTVHLVALELDSTEPGTLAEFARTVETDEDGLFEADLLPGLYRAVVQPTSPEFGARSIQLRVNDAPSQIGPTIQVGARHELSGRVVSFDRSTRVFGAAVQAGAVPEDDNVSVLEAAQGAIALSPAAIADVSGDDGAFSVLADEGVFHVSARPDPITGFAWAVRLGVEVNQDLWLGEIALPLPAVVRGRLSSKDVVGPVPGGIIRAYALLQDGVPTASVEDADSVVPVGESRVDDRGDFVLRLPSAFK